MKEAGEKVICEQSAGELEEKWCKYRDKRWNEREGGREKWGTDRGWIRTRGSFATRVVFERRKKNSGR